jgi:hypothetical protein
MLQFSLEVQLMIRFQHRLSRINKGMWFEMTMAMKYKRSFWKLMIFIRPSWSKTDIIFIRLMLLHLQEVLRI